MLTFLKHPRRRAKRWLCTSSLKKPVSLFNGGVKRHFVSPWELVDYVFAIFGPLDQTFEDSKQRWNQMVRVEDGNRDVCGKGWSGTCRPFAEDGWIASWQAKMFGMGPSCPILFEHIRRALSSTIFCNNFRSLLRRVRCDG